MRSHYLSASLAAILPLLSACGSSTPEAPFNGTGNRNRKSQGNAEIQGPDANDLIRQSRRDYNRDRYNEGRYYGNY